MNLSTNARQDATVSLPQRGFRPVVSSDGLSYGVGTMNYHGRKIQWDCFEGG